MTESYIIDSLRERKLSLKRLDGIQWLRGIAAIMVVVAHSEILFSDVFHRDFGAFLGFYGIGGVDIFFVISGFIMTVVTSGDSFSMSDFLIRRIIRVGPTYWFYTSIFYLTAVIKPSLFGKFVLSGSDFIQSILFLPHHNVVGELSPVILAGWTLNFEIFFYLVFAIFRSQIGKPAIFIALFFGMMISVGLVFDIQNAALFSYTRSIVLEFSAGCIIGQIYLSGRSFAGPVTVSCLLIGIAAFLALPLLIQSNGITDLLGNGRLIARGLPAIFLVFAVVVIPKKWVPKNNPMVFMGDISFSLYLTHTITLRIASLVMRGHDFSVYGAVLASIITIVTCFFAAVAAYYCLEQPITNGLTSIYEKSRFNQMPESKALT